MNISNYRSLVTMNCVFRGFQQTRHSDMAQWLEQSILSSLHIYGGPHS